MISFQNEFLEKFYIVEGYLENSLRWLDSFLLYQIRVSQGLQNPARTPDCDVCLPSSQL